MPIHHFDFGTSNINFVKQLDGRIKVTYLFINTINEKEDVTITPDFDYPIEEGVEYPVQVKFLFGGSEEEEPYQFVINTTLDKILFDGQMSTDEDDYDSKIMGLFAETTSEALELPDCCNRNIDGGFASAIYTAAPINGGGA